MTIRSTLSRLARTVAPIPVWNAYLRARGRAAYQAHPWRKFGLMKTCADPGPLLAGRFADLYAKYARLDPTMDPEHTRFRHYVNCIMAHNCRTVPGDFVCAGISYGVSARTIFDFVDFPKLDKTLHLIDPFDASDGAKGTAHNYNADPEFVRRQYPADARIKIHKDKIPMRLPGPLAFVMTATGVAEAEFESIPVFYEALSPGGVLLSGQYRELPGVEALWLPSGVAAYFKH